MKSIKFTDDEIEAMIGMYSAELEEAQIYIAHIQELLKKLGAKPVKSEVVEKEPKKGKKRGRKPSLKVVEKTEQKKRGRKPKGVLSTLSEVSGAAITVASSNVPATVAPAQVVTAMGKLKDAEHVNKVARKKSTGKQRISQMASFAKLTKPTSKKAPRAKAVAEAPSIVPGDAPVG